MKEGAAPFSERLLRGMTLLLFAAVAVEHVGHAVSVATFPHDLDNGEGFVLNQAALIARGESPWQPIEKEPYIVANFAPLYPWIVSLPIDGTPPSFAFGRWVSVTATLATVLLVAFLVRRLAGSTLAGALAGLVVLSSKFVYDWAGLHRIDALALLATTSGVALCVHSPRRPVLAGLAFALGLLARQTMVFAPVAAFLVALGDSRSTAIRLALATLVPSTVVYGVLGAATGGEFLRHAFSYNVQPFSGALLGTFGSHWLWYHPIFLGIGLFFLVSRLREKRLDLPAVYLLAAIPSFFLAGRVGAASNYMFELVVALAIAVGCAIAEAARRPDRSLSIALWCGLAIQPFLSHLTFNSPEVLPNPDRAFAERAGELFTLVGRTEGDVLAEDVGYLVSNGKRVVYEPYIFHRLAEDGRWDSSRIVQEVESVRFSLVVVGFDLEMDRSVRWDSAVVDALRRNYRSLARFAGPGGSERTPSPHWNYYVYVPARR